MLNKRLVTKVCLSTDALHAAFRLRYASYHGKGFIPDSSDKMFFDVYDALPNCVTFGVYDNAEMVASIRASVYAPMRGWHDIPAAQRFPEAFACWAASRDVVVEWNRFVISPGYSDRSTNIEIALLASVPFIAAFFKGISFLAAVRERHLKFYSRFGYHCIAEPTRYFGVNFFATLMAMDWEPHHERIRTHRVFSQCWDYLPSLEDVDLRSRRHFESRFREGLPE